MASVGIKRGRDSLECGREDEPLAKRINNLHLDTGAGTSSAPGPLSSGNGLLQHHPCLPLPCNINGVVTQIPSSVNPSNGLMPGHYHNESGGPFAQPPIRGQLNNFNQQNIHQQNIHQQNIHQQNIHQQNIHQQNIHQQNIHQQNIHQQNIHQQNIQQQNIQQQFQQGALHNRQSQMQFMHQQDQSQQQMSDEHLRQFCASHEELIARRELPESLSLHYPDSNPTTNPHYYNANKVLHHLHMNRLRRSLKIE